jgi:peroxiredoxin
MHFSATWLRYPLLLAVLACLVRAPLSGGSQGGAGGDFTLHDAAGRPFALHDLKGKKAVVIVFLSFECPICTGYARPLAELAGTYRDRDVAFVGISAGGEDAGRVSELARDAGLPFPVFADEDGVAAESLGAHLTPEVFVLDAGLVTRYRGRIDDRYRTRLKPTSRVTRHDLGEALDEILAGKPVTVPETPVVGCSIRRAPRALGGESAVTYYRDVLPILQERCQECHRPGEVAPFPLTTYPQAVKWAADIKDATRERKMPPWKPVDGLPMHGERRLTDDELARLAAWVDGGTPRGDPATAPAPRHFSDGWQLGPPDLVLSVDDEFTLGAEGSDLYRCFVLPTRLPQERDVIAVEVRPGNRRIVHHAVLFVDSTGRARQLQAAPQGRNQGKDDHGPGYSMPMNLAFLPGFLPEGGLGGWAPGLVIHPLSGGAGFHLPRGADVVMQLHYHRNGRVEKDRTTVGLYLAPRPAERRIQGLVVPGQFLAIPAGAERYRVTGTVWLRQDCHLHAVMPHMHLLGREMKLTMTPPGGTPRTLVAVKDWDFNWQETYFFQELVSAPAGTRFDVEAFYDNSAGNPNNPYSPPRPVVFGLQTTNEMCLGFLGLTVDQGGRVRYDLQPRVPGLESLKIPLPGI